MTLLDADLTKPGNQPFGDFDNGQPTNNDDNNGDGTYTIQSTDTAGINNDVGTFDVQTNPAQVARLGPIDITDETDTGADNTITSDGNPIISFKRAPDLTIGLKGPAGKALPISAYSIVESTSNGVTSYTVTLLDADPSKAGNQPFGDFVDGQPTNNSNNTGDGTYTIQSTDSVGSKVDVGSFNIRTNVLQPGEDFDKDGADDNFEIGKDGNLDGIDDSVQDTVATYLGSNGTSINVLELINPINTESNDSNNDWGITNATKLIFEGIAKSAEDISNPGKQ